MRALTSVRRDVLIVDRTVIVDRKVGVAVMAARAMDADRRDAAVAVQMMALATVGQKVGVAVRKDAAAKAVAPKVADRVGLMVRRDRRIRSGSSIASMKTKMAR